MESSTTNGDPFRRYEVIEKAYCEGRWATVLEAGTSLLRELSEEADQTELKGLRHRMHLLMAHTLLHGYGDRDAAEDLYTVVYQSDAESSLRQMAEDGLEQCHKPLTSTFVAEESEDNGDDIQDRPKLFLPETENTTLEGSATAPPPAKAAPLIVFHPSESSPPAPEAETSASPPRVPKAVRREEEDAPDAELAADPFQPSRRAQTETLNIGLPVMPWLTPTESEPEGEPVEEPTPRQSQGTLSRSASVQTLIPEVVEEPELMEVHQANPSLAEEVDLEPTLLGPSPRRAPEAMDQPPEDHLEDLRSSLLEITLD
jgi:hypothetical protein